jgi:hypothetical protein
MFRVVLILALAVLPAAQIQMPDPSELSGVPLPTADVPAGTVTVRVIRGDFSQNLAGQSVEFTIDDRTETVTTDEEGRAQVSGLANGARVRARTVVDGEPLESQQIVVGVTGIRVLLVATDPARAAREAEDRRLAEAPAVKGIVLLGPESRVVAQIANDRLTIFYVLQILNNARVPVDIGGPLIFDLPREARGTAIVEGSSTQATANGPRVIITGPFAPGPTMVQVAYELPTPDGTAHIVQRWPATLQELSVFVTQIGGIDVVSDRFTDKEEFMSDGRQVLLATGSTIPAGQTLEMELSGMPYHPRWPRYVALSLAGVFMALGIWGAITARPRRDRRVAA